MHVQWSPFVESRVNTGHQNKCPALLENSVGGEAHQGLEVPRFIDVSVDIQTAFATRLLVPHEFRQTIPAMFREQKHKERGGSPCGYPVVPAGRLAAAGHGPWQHTGTPPPAAVHLTCWSSPAPPCIITQVTTETAAYWSPLQWVPHYLWEPNIALRLSPRDTYTICYVVEAY